MIGFYLVVMIVLGYDKDLKRRILMLLGIISEDDDFNAEDHF